MPMFTKKPVTIEARQFDGTAESVAEMIGWMSSNGTIAASDYRVNLDPTATYVVVIPTLEGPHDANPGDWIIKGVKGEFYPCKPDIFALTYAPADSDEAASAVNLDDEGPMSFSAALVHLKHGHQVAREGWNGKGMWIMVVRYWDALMGGPSLEKRGLGTLPWVGMKTADNRFVPWLASQADLLANDWYVVNTTVWPEDEKHPGEPVR
jgi:hypothetical protein